jgi:hypothetical protein
VFVLESLARRRTRLRVAAATLVGVLAGLHGTLVAQLGVGQISGLVTFTLAPQFTLGSASRNPVRGPSYRNVDLVLSRRVPVRGANVELRVEAFNLLNTPPLANPNGQFGTGAFGTITSAGDPRVLQLAAKLSF